MTTPGLEVRTEPVEDPDVDVEGLEWTGPRLQRAIWGPQSGRMRLKLRQALATLADGRTAEELHDQLHDGGVDALAGEFAALAVRAAGELGRETDDDVDDLARAGGPVDRVWRVSGQLGRGTTALGPAFPSGRDDLGSGPAALLGLVDDVVPEVQVRLSSAFIDRRADHRRDVLDLLLALADGCRVALVMTPFVRRRLWELHRDRLPASVTEECNNPRSPGPVDGDDPVPVVVDRAEEILDPTGSIMTVLVALYSRPSESASYREIRSRLAIRQDHARKVAERLADLRLVERLSDHDGRTRVSLTPAGRRVARNAIGKLPDSGRHGGSRRVSADGGVTTPSQSSSDSRVTPRASTGEGETATPRPESAIERWLEYVGRPARPAGEAEAATAPTSSDRRASGQASLQRFPYADLRGLVATTGPEEGEVALVDAPAAEIPDPRTPLWGYVEGQDQLVVGCTGTRAAMQIWTTLARALSSRATFNKVLDEDRLQEVLDDVPRVVLERKSQIGGLAKGRAEDAARFREYLLEWTDDLCDLTRQYHAQRDDLDDDEDRSFRRTITTKAKGLAATMTALLDHAEVDVSRVVYADDLQQFSEDNVDALAETLAHQAAIESHVDGYPLFRQLFEARPKKRDFAIDPPDDVDPTGELLGSIVVVGSGVDRLTQPLRRRLTRPADVVDGAPELQVDVRLRRQGVVDVDGQDEPLCSRAAVERAAEAILPAKWLWSTDRVIDLLHQWLGSSLDVCRALSALRREDGRQVHPDEVRTALSALDPSRLVPGQPRTAQKGLAVLLAATDDDEPLSQAEVCRRGGISPSSWRRHKEQLALGGWIEFVDAGDRQGWRVQLPPQGHRGDDVDRRLPWFVDDHVHSTTSALSRLTDWLWPDRPRDVDDPLSDAVAWPPDPQAILDERPDLSEVLRAIRAGVGEASTSPSTVSIGHAPPGRQAGLSEWDDPLSTG